MLCVMFRHFLSDLYADWMGRMTNGIVPLALGVASYFVKPEWMKLAFFLAAFLVLFYSVYRVWEKKEKELRVAQAELDEEKVKNTRPNIVVEIQEVYTESSVSATGIHPNYIDEYFTLKVHLVNEGRPVAIRRFQLYVNFDKGVKPISTTSLNYLAFERKQKVSKIGVHYSTVETVQEALADLSQDKAIISRGDNREGWLRFVLTEVSSKQLEKITGITLCVVDAESNVHKKTAYKAQWRQTGELINTYRQEFQRELEKAIAVEEAKRKQIYNILGELIKEGREIEARKTNQLHYKNFKPTWRGRVYEFLQGVEGAYCERFGESTLESDIDTLESIQKEFTD